MQTRKHVLPPLFTQAYYKYPFTAEQKTLITGKSVPYEGNIWTKMNSQKTKQKLFHGEIPSSHSSKYEDDCPVGCYVVW
jgi:hypothetical protein